PLVVGDRVFVVTGNGTNIEGEVAAPKAPSFIALDKHKGTLRWQSNLPGERILEGQWSNPAYAVVHGKGQVICPGGDGWLYGLDADSGKLVWKFDCNPKRSAWKIGPDDPEFLLATWKLPIRPEFAGVLAGSPAGGLPGAVPWLPLYQSLERLHM